MRNNKYGQPHLWAWAEILKVYAARIALRPGSPEKEALKKEANDYDAAVMNLASLQQEVKHVRVVKAYKQEFRKLEISIKDGTPSDKMWLAIKADLLEVPRVDELPGVAPQATSSDKSRPFWISSKRIFPAFVPVRGITC